MSEPSSPSEQGFVGHEREVKQPEPHATLRHPVSTHPPDLRHLSAFRPDSDVLGTDPKTSVTRTGTRWPEGKDPGSGNPAKGRVVDTQMEWHSTLELVELTTLGWCRRHSPVPHLHESGSLNVRTKGHYSWVSFFL